MEMFKWFITVLTEKQASLEPLPQSDVDMAVEFLMSMLRVLFGL